MEIRSESFWEFGRTWLVLFGCASLLLWRNPAPKATPAATTNNAEVISLVDSYFLYSKYGAVFVDIRAPNEFARTRVRGAVNLPAGRPWDLPGELVSARAVVVYDGTGQAGNSARTMVRRLSELGVKEAKISELRLSDWSLLGLPLEKEVLK